MRFIKLFFLFALIIGNSIAKAQTLKNIKNFDTNYYFYNLNANQLSYLNKNGIKDTDYLFSNLAQKSTKEFTQSIDSFAYGSFIQVRILENKIYYQLYSKAPFNYVFKKIDKDYLMYLKLDTAKDLNLQSIICNATITCNNVIIPFDSGYGAYVFPAKFFNKKEFNKPITKEFFIAYQGKDYLYQMNKTPEPRINNNRNNSNQPFNIYGYMVTDKPLYKPLDTLRLKAYCLDDKGIAFKEKGVLKLVDLSNNKIIFSRKLNYTTKGAYLYQYIIPDTLKTDRSYGLQLFFARDNTTSSIQTTFKVQDYLLNKSVLSMQLNKANYTAGEDLKLKITTTDANGFPLNEVRLKYKLSINSINNIIKDTFILSQLQKDNWLELDTLLPYEKVHNFTIPFTKLPPVSGTFYLSASLLDAQFEKKEYTTSFTYDATSFKTIFKQDKDSLVIRKLHNGMDTAQIFNLKLYSAANKLLDSLTITSPFKMLLKPNYARAFLYAKEALVASTNLFYNQLDILQTKGIREARQVKITFKYPFEQAVYYKIFKADKLLEQGCKQQINFVTTDSTLDDYRMLLSTNLHGAIENNVFQIVFHALNKKLNLSCSLPAEAYPGETIPVEYTITDFYGRPVKDANIASFGINAMFENEISEPYIYVPEKYKNSSTQTSLAGKYDYLQLYPINKNSIFNLTKNHIVKYTLNSNEYYQLLYPKNGMQLIKNPMQQPNPELSVFITKNGVAYMPKYIKANNQFLYISTISNPNKFSFAMPSAKVDISIRFFEKIIEIPNIALDSFTKTYVVINFDSLQSGVLSNAKLLKDSFTIFEPTPSEWAAIKKSILLLSNYQVDSIMYFSNSKISRLNHTYYSNTAASVKVQDDYYNAFLPYDITQVGLQNGRQSHNLSTGNKFYFYNTEVKDFTEKPITDKTPYFFAFTEINANINQIGFQLQKDTMATLPQTPITQNVKNYIAPSNKLFNANSFLVNTNYYSHDSLMTIQIFNGQKKKIQNVWIINNIEYNKSIFAATNNLAVYSNNAYSPVDIYLFFADEKIRVLKNIILRNKDVLYINADSLTNDTLQEEILSSPLSIYNRIMQVPYTPFYDAPLEERGLKLANTNFKNGDMFGYIKGNLVSEDLSPVQDALVIFEQGGKFIKGGISNSKGEFECIDLKVGVYDIKIFHANYQLKYYYQVSIGGNYGQSFTSILNTRESLRPYYETFNNNFRYSAYLPFKDSQSFAINIFEYLSRQTINNAIITLLYKDSSVQKIVCNNYKIILSQTQITNCIALKIEAKGFNTIDMSGLPSATKLLQQLDVFMNIFKNKTDMYMLTFNSNEQQDRYIKQNSYGINNAPPPPHPNLNNYENAPLKKLSAVNVNAASSASYSVSDAAGSYTLGKEVLLSGGRVENTVYMVDGQLVGGATLKNVPGVMDINLRDENKVSKEEYNMNNQEEGVDSENLLENQKQEENTRRLFNTLLASNIANQYRKNFSDVAFWQPNLITDLHGKAYCNITLPDNITSWKTFNIAMGEGFLFGQKDSSLKVYKPLQTNNYIPGFLHLGDSVQCKSKFTNLLSSAKQVNLFFDINGLRVKNVESNLINFLYDSIPLVAKNLNPIIYTAGLQWQDKYTDAEQTQLPVYTNAITQNHYQSILANQDSTYYMQFGYNATGVITFNNTMYERILQYAKDLENYSYGCVEQTASKLKALVYQQIIYRALNKNIDKQKDIKKLIAKLEDMQNDNGSFGWWRKGEGDIRMTAYAADALQLAYRHGFVNAIGSDACRWLQKQIKKASMSDQLFILYTLHEHQFKNIEAKDLERFTIINANTTDKMYYYKLKLAAEMNVDNADLYALGLELNNNSRINTYDNFFYDSRANVFNAYQLFKNTALEAQMKSQFEQQILNGAFDNQLNTFSKAALIGLLLSDIKDPKNKGVVAKVFINDTLEIKNYPFVYNIKNNQVKISHLGAPVFIQSAEDYQIENPNIVDSIFSVQTKFIQSNTATQQLKRGIDANLNIKLTAFKSKDYVMISVPIPAGIIIKNKKQILGGQDYIEYRKNEIIIFKSNLSQGQTNIDIPIQAKYSGLFNMPPAQVSMMYYPFVNGNNKQQQIGIE